MYMYLCMYLSFDIWSASCEDSDRVITRRLRGLFGMGAH